MKKILYKAMLATIILSASAHATNADLLSIVTGDAMATTKSNILSNDDMNSIVGGHYIIDEVRIPDIASNRVIRDSGMVRKVSTRLRLDLNANTVMYIVHGL